MQSQQFTRTFDDFSMSTCASHYVIACCSAAMELMDRLILRSFVCLCLAGLQPLS